MQDSPQRATPPHSLITSISAQDGLHSYSSQLNLDCPPCLEMLLSLH